MLKRIEKASGWWEPDSPGCLQMSEIKAHPPCSQCPHPSAKEYPRKIMVFAFFFLVGIAQSGVLGWLQEGWMLLPISPALLGTIIPCDPRGREKILPSLAAPAPALMEAKPCAGLLMSWGLFTAAEDGNKPKNLLALFWQS